MFFACSFVPFCRFLPFCRCLVYQSTTSSLFLPIFFSTNHWFPLPSSLSQYVVSSSEHGSAPVHPPSSPLFNVPSPWSAHTGRLFQSFESFESSEPAQSCLSSDGARNVCRRMSYFSGMWRISCCKIRRNFDVSIFIFSSFYFISSLAAFSFLFLFCFLFGPRS